MNKTTKERIEKRKTSNIPRTPRKRKGGYKQMNGAEDGVPFTAENQPTPEQKKDGWLKKKRGAELMKIVMELQFKGAQNSQLKQQAADYFGVSVETITPEVMMAFRQVEKAIQTADTQAFNSVWEKAFGRPTQSLQIANPDGSNIFESKTENQLLEILQQTLTKLNDK